MSMKFFAKVVPKRAPELKKSVLREVMRKEHVHQAERHTFSAASDVEVPVVTMGTPA
jgi:hypothetical protein